MKYRIAMLIACLLTFVACTSPGETIKQEPRSLTEFARLSETHWTFVDGELRVVANH